MSDTEKLLQKFQLLAAKKPLGIDMTIIDPSMLYSETQKNDQLKTKLTRFGQIFKELEGLKQFVAPYYKSNSDKIHSFRDAIFYNELVQIQVFFEFIKDIQTDPTTSPNLYHIFQKKTDLKLNKIRNSIAHFDWTLNNGAIIFRDKNFKISVNYFEISEFCSLISMIAIFMTNNINKIE
ncbi:MAG: hypothetical protein PWR20_2093 [Bacteroidales bacterium]|jgi:hypothetical protein|nr:hypothetical protein [Bacteroidales bacterium]MDN5329279.1 hypothetical protein [Bacteroidales bacterium]NLH51277.1 hypothetical protein [Bacteroidales bacterium]